MKNAIFTFLILIFSISIIIAGCRDQNQTTEQKIEAALKEIDREAEEVKDKDLIDKNSEETLLEVSENSQNSLINNDKKEKEVNEVME